MTAMNGVLYKTLIIWGIQLLLYGTPADGAGKSFYVNRQAFSEDKISETEAMIMKSASTDCTNTGIEIAFRRNMMIDLGIGPNQFTLLDEECMASANDTHYILYTPLTDCNSSVIPQSAGKVQVTNTVIVKPPGQLADSFAYRSSLMGVDVSSSNERVEISVTCNYRLPDQDIGSSNQDQTFTDIEGQQGSGQPVTSFGGDIERPAISAQSVDIEIYRTDSFAVPYQPDTDIVTKGTSLYVKVELKGGRLAETSNVFLESCHLTDMSNGNPERYYLIQSGCPYVSRDVQIKNDNTPYYRTRKFLFRAQRPFKNRPMMLLCNVVPCFDSQCTSQADYCSRRQTGSPADSDLIAVYGQSFTVLRRGYNPPPPPPKPTTTTVSPAVAVFTTKPTSQRLVQLANPTPPAISCPPQRVYPQSACKCPERDVAAETSRRRNVDTDEVTVSIGVTIGVAIGMFVLGATLVGLLWLIYVKTDPTQRLKPVAISEDGISSSQESANAVTQRLMGNSREITAGSLQS